MKMKYLILFVVLAATNPVLADTDDDYHHMDNWDGHMTEFSLVGIFMWTMMVLWIALLLSAIYYLIKKANRSD